MPNPLEFKKAILVYLPCYNCAGKIAQTISQIPKELYDKIECLVVDNFSTDSTADEVEEEIKKNIHPFPIRLLRNQKNLGYAGSQKTAYALASQSSVVKHVVMLHGDGQYPPVLLS